MIIKIFLVLQHKIRNLETRLQTFSRQKSIVSNFLTVKCLKILQSHNKFNNSKLLITFAAQLE